MVNFKAFSIIKNVFNKLNPLNSFDFGESDLVIIKPPTSDELLEKTIKKFLNLKK